MAITQNEEILAADLKNIQMSLEKLKIESGSYEGTGVFGPEHPNSITFSFRPKVFMLFNGVQLLETYYNYFNLGADQESFYKDVIWNLDNLTEEYKYICGFYSSNELYGETYYYAKMNDNTFSWYFESTGTRANEEGFGAQCQFNYSRNSKANTYYWVAIG